MNNDAIKPTSLDPVDSILTFDLSSWDEFEAAIRDEYHADMQREPSSIEKPSPLLFRGQRNASWPLQTTLERQQRVSFRLIDYFKIISMMLRPVESYTNNRFELPDFFEYMTKLKETKSPFHASSIPGYEFMVYLRHFGFPSPLLDWTESPYVAAYFAFSDECTCVSKRVAIYSYQESLGFGKVVSPSEAHIYTQDYNTRKHKRHFLQQCSYTACIMQKDDNWIYAQYKDATSKHYSSQDSMRKYTLPATERGKALQSLNRYNINDFSLFESEESLMKTMTMRIFDFPSAQARLTAHSKLI